MFCIPTSPPPPVRRGKLVRRTPTVRYGPTQIRRRSTTTRRRLKKLSRPQLSRASVSSHPPPVPDFPSHDEQEKPRLSRQIGLLWKQVRGAGERLSNPNRFSFMPPGFERVDVTGHGNEISAAHGVGELQQ